MATTTIQTLFGSVREREREQRTPCPHGGDCVTEGRYRRRDDGDDKRARFWESLAKILLGVVITLAGVYFTTVRDAMSRSQVDDAISRHPMMVEVKKELEAVKEQHMLLMNAQSVQGDKIDAQSRTIDRVAIAVGVTPADRPQRQKP